MSGQLKLMASHKVPMKYITCQLRVVSQLLIVVDCVLLLLAHGATIKIKNTQGWSPLAEAVSYGDRQISWFYSCFFYS